MITMKGNNRNKTEANHLIYLLHVQMIIDRYVIYLNKVGDKKPISE